MPDLVALGQTPPAVSRTDAPMAMNALMTGKTAVYHHIVIVMKRLVSGSVLTIAMEAPVLWKNVSI